MRSGVKDMKRSDRYNNILRKKKKYIPVMLGVCMLGSALSGCGFVANPMQYMKDADKEFFQAEDGIRDKLVTGVQTCALPILLVGDERTTNISYRQFGTLCSMPEASIGCL